MPKKNNYNYNVRAFFEKFNYAKEKQYAVFTRNSSLEKKIEYLRSIVKQYQKSSGKFKDVEGCCELVRLLSLIVAVVGSCNETYMSCSEKLVIEELLLHTSAMKSSSAAFLACFTRMRPTFEYLISCWEQASLQGVKAHGTIVGTVNTSYYLRAIGQKMQEGPQEVYDSLVAIRKCGTGGKGVAGRFSTTTVILHPLQPGILPNPQQQHTDRTEEVGEVFLTEKCEPVGYAHEKIIELLATIKEDDEAKPICRKQLELASGFVNESSTHDQGNRGFNASLCYILPKETSQLVKEKIITFLNFINKTFVEN